MTCSVDIGATVVVARNVPATVCDQCGEHRFADAVVQQLERIAEEARSRGAQVEILALP